MQRKSRVVLELGIVAALVCGVAAAYALLRPKTVLLHSSGRAADAAAVSAAAVAAYAALRAVIELILAIRSRAARISPYLSLLVDTSPLWMLASVFAHYPEHTAATLAAAGDAVLGAPMTKAIATTLATKYTDAMPMYFRAMVALLVVALLLHMFVILPLKGAVLVYHTVIRRKPTSQEQQEREKDRGEKQKSS